MMRLLEVLWNQSRRGWSRRSWSRPNWRNNVVLLKLHLCYFNAALWGSIQLQPGSGHFCTSWTIRNTTTIHEQKSIWKIKNPQNCSFLWKTIHKYLHVLKKCYFLWNIKWSIAYWTFSTNFFWFCHLGSLSLEIYSTDQPGLFSIR
jgi:hypothetical protein